MSYYFILPFMLHVYDPWSVLHPQLTTQSNITNTQSEVQIHYQDNTSLVYCTKSLLEQQLVKTGCERLQERQ